MYTYICLHIYMAIYDLCISTYFYANIPTHAYKLLHPYTFFMFTYFYAHIAIPDYIFYVHIRTIHFYIFLHPYSPNV
jgi:hypothetical protein